MRPGCSLSGWVGGTPILCVKTFLAMEIVLRRKPFPTRDIQRITRMALLGEVSRCEVSRCAVAGEGLKHETW